MPDDITGAAGAGFPATRWSAVAGAGSEDPAERTRSFETLIAAYWKPVYKYIRIKWRRTGEDAKDLTQAFFARAFEKSFFKSYDPGRSRFRTFLRVCLDGFIANEDKSARRLKRGGGVPHLSLEFERAEGELAAVDPPAPETLERYFDIEWTRNLFELAVTSLREECAKRGKEKAFELFERYDLDPPREGRVTYVELGRQTGLTTTQVTNNLAFARREFRRLLLETLRSITATDEEFRLEAVHLLGYKGGEDA